MLEEPLSLDIEGQSYDLLWTDFWIQEKIRGVVYTRLELYVGSGREVRSFPREMNGEKNQEGYWISNAVGVCDLCLKLRGKKTKGASKCRIKQNSILGQL